MADLNGHGISQKSDDSDSGSAHHETSERDCHSAQTRKNKQLTRVNKLIADNKVTQSNTLDLSNNGLRSIPNDLLQLGHLQYLYLEGNDLRCLPENFFDCLPQLCWLDLRNNYLVGLPNAYIGRHTCLRNLLLEGNQLRTLPLELGLVSTLTGLNIANNPLEFPPPEIIEKGTRTILAFFQELLKAKVEGRVPPVPTLTSLKIYDSDPETDNSDQRKSVQTRSSNSQRSRYGRDSLPSESRDSRLLMTLGDGEPKSSDLPAPHPHSAALHTPSNQLQLRQLQLQQLKRAHALRTVLNTNTPRRGRNRDRKSKRSVRYGETPPPELVQKKFLEEKRLAKLRELKEKQELILQRRRDQDILREFRDNGRELQQRKHMEKRIKGRLDYVEPAKQAPYDVSADDMRVPSNEERIAYDIKKKHEKLRRMSPETKAQLEEARAVRDRELEKRLKQHTAEMHQRRRMPQGTPQEEMLAAQHELRMAEELQKEIEARRKELDYRFTAFTGEAAPARMTRNTVKY